MLKSGLTLPIGAGILAAITAAAFTKPWTWDDAPQEVADQVNSNIPEKGTIAFDYWIRQETANALVSLEEGQTYCPDQIIDFEIQGFAKGIAQIMEIDGDRTVFQVSIIDKDGQPHNFAIGLDGLEGPVTPQADNCSVYL